MLNHVCLSVHGTGSVISFNILFLNDFSLPNCSTKWVRALILLRSVTLMLFDER